MRSFLHLLLGLGGWQAVVLLSVFPLLESSVLIGIVIPGETALILGGVLVYVGRVSFVAMAVAGSVGAVIGDAIGYWVGRRWGERLQRTRAARWIGKRRWQRARRHMQRRGFAAVAFGRFPPGVRSLVPLLAGTSAMPFGRFLAANVLGGVLWAVSAVALGWAAGAAWERVHHWVTLILFGLVVAAAVFWVLRMRRHGARPKPA